MSGNESLVVVHFDDDGEISYYVAGVARLLIVDERAPHDRVYEYLSRSDPAEVKALLGGDAIGSSQDERHAAIAARTEGRHLALVPPHDSEEGSR